MNLKERAAFAAEVYMLRFLGVVIVIALLGIAFYA